MYFTSYISVSLFVSHHGTITPPMLVHRVTAFEGHPLNIPKSKLLACSGPIRIPQSAQISASHQQLLHQHLVADTQGQLPISASDGWAGGAGRRDDELQSEASSGTVINGVLPETSASPLSIIGRAEKPSEGMTVSVVRSLTVGGFHRHILSVHDQSDSTK